MAHGQGREDLGDAGWGEGTVCTCGVSPSLFDIVHRGPVVTLSESSLATYYLWGPSDCPVTWGQGSVSVTPQTEQ